MVPHKKLSQWMDLRCSMPLSEFKRGKITKWCQNWESNRGPPIVNPVHYPLSNHLTPRPCTPLSCTPLSCTLSPCTPHPAPRTLAPSPHTVMDTDNSHLNHHFPLAVSVPGIEVDGVGLMLVDLSC